ncbi:MAG: ABC transporter ATP-binding protein [Promethearchaeota archaeon]
MTISAKEISFNYGSKLVLKDITIHFQKGFLYGILGPNGSGKTTFLKILSGVLKSELGEVIVDDILINTMNPREIAKKIAMVPQTTSINFDYTVEEIVMMGRYSHIGRFSQESPEDKRIVDEILKKLKLHELRKRSFNELSGGELQKVIIGRALAQNGKIILLDEPTTHLDINYKIEFMMMMRNYVEEGKIIIAVLHDLNLAAQFCDKIILLNDGKIKAFGPVEEIITRENIKTVYNIDVVVRKNVYTNSIFVTPLNIQEDSNNRNMRKNAKKVHVIAGGGSAVEFLPNLNSHDVSIGIINVLDDDHTLASELNYKIISEAPFSPITEESKLKLKNFLKEVDVVILANLPFGKYNLKNLEILQEFDKPIIIHEKEPIGERDYTSGSATRIYNELKKKANVRIVEKTEDILKILNNMRG